MYPAWLNYCLARPTTRIGRTIAILASSAILLKLFSAGRSILVQEIFRPLQWMPSSKYGSHLPRPVKSSEGNRSIKNFPRWWQATKYLEGNSSEFLSDRLVDVGASSCQAEDGRLPRLPCVPPPASHPHKPESHQESHSCARCKYIGPCMVPVIAVVYFCLPVIWKVKVRRQQLTYMFK